jgi:Protein of unknown function DUF262/Protein of unknown function (DUF1524)
MAFEKPITIQKAIQEIQSNRFVLPAIQREFIWKVEQIENLFDSLMKGYPVGTFLFWEVQPDRIVDFQFYRFMDWYHERDHTHNDPINLNTNREVIAVLDGQQRLTALTLGLVGSYAYKLPRYWWSSDEGFPKRELYLNLLGEEGIPQNGYEFKFLRDSDLANPDESKYWFKVGDILKFEDIQSTFAYCVEQGLTENRKKYPSNALMGLWRVVHELPIIQYFLEEEQDLDKVLNIFIRVNSGGTPLSYSDMLLSIATAAWKERDARQEIYKLVETLNSIGDGFSFDKDFVLKASLFLTDISAIEFRVNSFNRENMLIIEENWNRIASALKGAAYLLAAWGYNWQNLISNLAVIPLAYFLYQIHSPSNFTTAGKFDTDRAKMRYWLRVALLKRTFSGSSDNALRNVRRAMQGIKTEETFPSDSIFDALSKTTRAMRFDEPELEGVLSYRYGQRYTFTVLSFLYPWLKYDQQFHLDHVFPQSMFTSRELRKRGIPEENWHLWLDQVNGLGNLQLLQGPVNQSKSDQEFESWIKGECPSPADLCSYRELHMIPNVDLSFENFPEFYEARTKLMREKLAELLHVKLTGDDPVK